MGRTSLSKVTEEGPLSAAIAAPPKTSAAKQNFATIEPSRLRRHRLAVRSNRNRVQYRVLSYEPSNRFLLPAYRASLSAEFMPDQKTNFSANCMILPPVPVGDE